MLVLFHIYRHITGKRLWRCILVNRR